MNRRQLGAVLLTVTLMFAVEGCRKKGPAPPPPPRAEFRVPEPPAAPKATIASFTAEPNTIDRGGSSTLRYSTENAVGVRIESAGQVVSGASAADSDATAAAVRAASALKAARDAAGSASGANAEAAKRSVAGLEDAAKTAAARAGITVEQALAFAGPLAKATLPATGTMPVSPSATQQYTLIAVGPGGESRQSVTVRVNEPAPPPPPTPTAAATLRISDIVSSQIGDAFFDYDKSDLREDARDAMQKAAGVLKDAFAKIPSGHVVVEGHCDERGSAEYNLGLGDRRSTSARDFLVQLGVPADRLKVVSYGKEKPQCTDSNEGCYQKNRRAHLVGVD